MAITVKCINCDYFNALNEGVDNSGQCRRWPPRGIDEKAIPSSESDENVFPFIEDADADNEFCGEFKLITTTTT